MKTIFCNYYSWLSLGMIFLTTILSVDFGKMREYEKSAMGEERSSVFVEIGSDCKGRVMDLLLPVIALIVLSIISMLYTGGFFGESMSIGDAFANCNAILGLAMGSVYSVIFVAILYLPRGIVTPKGFLDGLVQGFINMVPATLILTFAWTLSGICGKEYLDAGGFVASIVEEYSISLNMMSAIFYVVSLLLAFSTGTSWGTFAILLPITVSVFGDQLMPLMVITTAAVLGGSVCGDHISPISDTTILSSTGAGCNHLKHVSTQMQYAMIVAGISTVSYIVSGYFENSTVGMVFGWVVLLAFILVIKYVYKNCLE